MQVSEQTPESGSPGTRDVATSVHDTIGSRPHEETQVCVQVSKGLTVALHQHQGSGAFLSVTESPQYSNTVSPSVNPVLRTPCMEHISSTIYATHCDTVYASTVHSSSHPTLIDALWYLFMHCNANADQEPATPEALAVMVHLAVKRLGTELSAPCSACNDIKCMYSTSCESEKEFVPIAAIVEGLFHVNIELHVNAIVYHVLNEHYKLWAPGYLCFENDRWHTRDMRSDQATGPVVIPREKRASDCYYTGTICAYTRLNALKVWILWISYSGHTFGHNL